MAHAWEYCLEIHSWAQMTILETNIVALQFTMRAEWLRKVPLELVFLAMSGNFSLKYQDSLMH